MLLLLGSGWKQKDKVPQVCMQILEWCIAMHIINRFESLQEFMETKKSCLRHVSVTISMASLKALLIWRCRGWPGWRLVCCDICHVLGHQLFGVRLWVLVFQDTSSSTTFLPLWRGCVSRVVGPSSEFDLVETIMWCSLVWLSFTAPGLNCHVSVCETSGFVLSAPDSSCVWKSGWLCCWV